MRNGIEEYYRIGLDIGIASVGWACLACDNTGEVKHILDLGVRTFDIPENPKNGESLAAPRREKRSLRRRIRRGAHRLERARKLLGTEKEKPDDYKNTVRANVYELRVKALDEKISESDFARVLMLILKRRGYSSYGKKESAEDGKLKEAIKANESKLADCGYRTVGEMLYKEGSCEHNGIKTLNVRNHNDYKLCVTRDMLKYELQTLFAAQRKFGNALATEQIEREFLNIFTAQRSFDEGPGTGSKYSADFKIGKCPFEDGEERAAKATYSFEYFRFLQSLNHIKILCDGAERGLTESERESAINYCMFRESVKYSDLRRLLKLPENALFNSLNYPKNKEDEKENNPEKARFCGMPASCKIRKALNDGNKDNLPLLDILGEILSKCKSEKRIYESMANEDICAVLSDDEKRKLADLSFSGFGHMSLKAIKNVLPFLKQGLIYSDAMNKAGYEHSNPYKCVQKSYKIKLADLGEEFADITSPAVRRAVSQTVKVVNAVIDKYGSPVAINVELARELGKTKSDRDTIKKENDKRWEDNEKNMQMLRDRYGIANPTGKLWVKYRLYDEQGGKCMYSGKPLDIDRVLHDDKYAEVDHVIPYSRSFCDARYNKVLVLTEENQKKGNRLPREYITEPLEWEEFCVRVNLVKDRRKREVLLREKFTKEDAKAWKERTLNDTKYISSFVFNLFKNRLEFANCDMGPKRVFAVNGVVTSYARKLWGIQKIREDGDLHHLVDAAVIGCVTEGFTKALTSYAKRREFRYAFVDNKFIDVETGELILPDKLKDLPERLPKPHEKFTDEIEMRLSENPNLYNDEYFKFGYDSAEVANVHKVFVSRAPERKAKGQIHLETVYSHDKRGEITLKTALTDLKLKDGEIENYNEFAKQSDKLLYEALKKRLIEFNGDAKKAFAEPFHKPKADGADGPIVRKVIINQNITAPVKLDRGSAKNDGMVRVDIFCKDGKFYGVPVYVVDVYKGELPNKAAVAHKPESEWLEMTDEYEFKFSLYKNDLIYLESKKEMRFAKCNADKNNKEFKLLINTFSYYKGFNRSTAAMDFILHDNSFIMEGKGIQGLLKFRKFGVDMLGNIYEIKSEKRPPTSMKKGK